MRKKRVENSGGKKNFGLLLLIVIAVIAFLMFNGDKSDKEEFQNEAHEESVADISNNASSDKDNESQEDKENTDAAEKDEDVKEEEYSRDRTANEIIGRYNKRNPDNQIVEEMVSCPENSGNHLTVIKFDVLDFIITEADGSPSFKCQSTLKYSQENTEDFLSNAFSIIRAVEEDFTDNEIEQLITSLQEVEYPFSNVVTVGERRFHFDVPQDKDITYQLSWKWAELY